MNIGFIIRRKKETEKRACTSPGWKVPSASCPPQLGFGVNRDRMDGGRDNVLGTEATVSPGPSGRWGSPPQEPGCSTQEPPAPLGPCCSPSQSSRDSAPVSRESFRAQCTCPAPASALCPPWLHSGTGAAWTQSPVLPGPSLPVCPVRCQPRTEDVPGPVKNSALPSQPSRLSSALSLALSPQSPTTRDNTSLAVSSSLPPQLERKRQRKARHLLVQADTELTVRKSAACGASAV